MIYSEFTSCVLVLTSVVSALGLNLVCYYDSKSHDRIGDAKFGIDDLEYALQFCTHVIYRNVGINPENYQVTSLNPHLDIEGRHLAEVTALKEKYPSVKFLLSVGGETEDPKHYLQLLEAGPPHKQSTFIQSARDMVREFNFDGLDLSFQLPRNKPRKVHSLIGRIIKTVTKIFTGDFIVDPKSEEHKEQLTDLIGKLSSALRADNLLLSLTVEPNVNSSWYFDVPRIINNVVMVNLHAFDFVTPQRNPKEADFSAPLFEEEEYQDKRLPHYNVNFQVEHWTSQHAPPSKINVGIAAHGLAWKLTKNFSSDEYPIVKVTAGPVDAGLETRIPGKLSYTEICKLSKFSNFDVWGNFVFRPVDKNNKNGIWITSEKPYSAADKASYVIENSLGGVALDDLSNDDFRGLCEGPKFPILRAIKNRLL